MLEWIRGYFAPLAVASLIGVAACGPTCPEAKAALGPDQAMAGDVQRVNALVARRRAAMEEAAQGGLDSFALQRVKFSVTAYELATEVQLRIIKLSPRYEDSELYDKAAALINDARCLFDELLEGEGHAVADGLGRRVQQMRDRFAVQIRKEGTLSSGELATYLEEGIKTGDDE